MLFKGTVSSWIESKHGNSDKKKLQGLVKVFKTCHKAYMLAFALVGNYRRGKPDQMNLGVFI